MTTATEILKTVIELAKENPEKTAGCKYVNDDGTPCCIVGHALIKHGLKATDFDGSFDGYDGRVHPINTYGVIFGLLAKLGIEEDDKDVVRRLARIQAAQDAGITWSDAVASAAEPLMMVRFELR